MGAGIIRVAKVKAPQLGGLQHHIDRESPNHSNPDIDVSRSDLNQTWHERGDYEDFVARRIAEGRTSKRAVRKDAVVLVDGIVTLPREDYLRLGDAATEQYLQDAREFVIREFGQENLAYYTIHLDETVPHAHWGAVPLKDGSLSWKNYFGSKYALSAFQDRFFEQVSSKYGLDRGHKRQPGENARRHKDVAEMKAQTEQELAEAEKELGATLAEITKATERLESVRRLAEDAIEECEQLGARVERLEGERVAAAGRVHDLERKAGSERDRIEGLELQRTEAAGRVGQLEQDREAAAGRVEAVGVQRDEAAGRVRGLERAIERARAAIEQVAGQIRDAAGRIKELGSRLTEARRPLLPPISRFEANIDIFGGGEYRFSQDDCIVEINCNPNAGIYTVQVAGRDATGERFWFSSMEDSLEDAWNRAKRRLGARGEYGGDPQQPLRQPSFAREREQERRPPSIANDIQMASRSARTYGGGMPPTRGFSR